MDEEPFMEEICLQQDSNLKPCGTVKGPITHKATSHKQLVSTKSIVSLKTNTRSIKSTVKKIMDYGFGLGGTPPPCQ